MQFGNINHVLRAVAGVTGHNAFVIIGASAVIARLHGRVSVSMTATAEVDVYAFNAENVEDLSDMIDANIGQDSLFHSTFGYYADGVSPETAKMPIDWMDRAVRYNPPESPEVAAILPDVNDIALAKLVAWREKDIDWLEEGLGTEVLSLEDMKARIPSMPPECLDLSVFEQKFQILQRRIEQRSR